MPIALDGDSECHSSRAGLPSYVKKLIYAVIENLFLYQKNSCDMFKLIQCILVKHQIHLDDF